MRVLLFTGKGGVGKTSVAAATALRAAASGARTLILSTDAAHSLADSFDVPVGARPTPVAECLEAQQIDAQERLEEHWREIQTYLVALMQWGGVGEVEAEELSVLPGLEEVFSLVDVKRHVDAGLYDLLVVDCAPTAETLRLLSLPDALGWYIERIFPVERRIARAIRPILSRMTTMPLPADRVLGAVDGLYRSLEAVRAVLADGERTSVRLVVNPEKMIVAEARRTYTYLSLFGYHVDAVVVNRLLPDAVTDAWFARWKQVQATHLLAIREQFAPVPILTAPLFDDEMVGVAALERLGAAVYGDATGHEVLHRGEPLRFTREEGGWTLSVALPFADKPAVDAFRRGDELYVKVGAYTRSILLPTALQRCDVAGAALDDGRLDVRFVQRPPVAPDPPP